eukprot:scaffold9465_cov45-Attheya_sp.AAC.2
MPMPTNRPSPCVDLHTCCDCPKRPDTTEWPTGSPVVLPSDVPSWPIPVPLRPPSCTNKGPSPYCQKYPSHIDCQRDPTCKDTVQSFREWTHNGPRIDRACSRPCTICKCPNWLRNRASKRAYRPTIAPDFQCYRTGIEFRDLRREQVHPRHPPTHWNVNRANWHSHYSSSHEYYCWPSTMRMIPEPIGNHGRHIPPQHHLIVQGETGSSDQVGTGGGRYGLVIAIVIVIAIAGGVHGRVFGIFFQNGIGRGGGGILSGNAIDAKDGTTADPKSSLHFPEHHIFIKVGGSIDFIVEEKKFTSHPIWIKVTVPKGSGQVMVRTGQFGQTIDWIVAT